MTGIAGASLCLINSLPFLQPLVGAFLPATLNASQCPYKSPTSWFIHNAGIVLLGIPELFLNALPWDWVRIHVRLHEKLGSWHRRLTGFDWKLYDWMCLRLRTGVYSPLSYFESGLISALDRFPYEGEAKDIISSYLENLVPYFDSAQEWETFSQEDLSNDEKSFLDDRHPSHLFPRHLHTVGLQLERTNRIRVDFLSALILQHLAKRHERLAPQLLHRRVELYIRVKNSTEFILSRDSSRLDVGRSLYCPFADHEELDLELKFQFLRCVRHLIDIRGTSDFDIMSAATIVRNESVLDPAAKEEHTRLLPNQSSPKNIQIGDLSNQPDSGTTSSPPNGLETGEPESAIHTTSAEDHQFRASFEILCLEMRERLSQLTPSDFAYIGHYLDLRRILRLPVEFGPESVDTGVKEV